MRNKVLYFPNIEVPRSAWLTRMLLYWDTVGVIMPYQYVEEPEELNEHTRDLVRANLVTQVIPSEYIGDIPNFSNAFLSYINSLGREIERRRKRFREHRFSRLSKELKHRKIHIEKLGSIPIHSEKTNDLAEELIDLRLAKRIDSSWLSVEPRTAQEFMYYLATVLGRHPTLQFAPVTDRYSELEKLSSLVAPDYKIDDGLDMLRLQVLEDVLPSPTRPLSAWDIENFKRRHGDQLSRFRRSIEMELTRLADIKNPSLRKRQLELFKDGMREEVEDIKSKMTSQWSNIVLGKFCAILGVIPVINLIPSLINATYNAVRSEDAINENSPLAYAAYAQKELLHY